MVVQKNVLDNYVIRRSRSLETRVLVFLTIYNWYLLLLIKKQNKYCFYFLQIIIYTRLFLLGDLKENSEFHLFRGNTKYDVGDLEGAFKDLDKSIELNPTDFKLYINRGLKRKKNGDLDGAFNDFSKSIELNPMETDAYLARGLVIFKLGSKESACSDWEIAKRMGEEAASLLIEEYCK